MALISDHQTVISLLEERVENAADVLFARFDQQDLTIGDLYQRVEQSVEALVVSGIGPGDRVAVMLDNSLDYVVLFFSLIKVGAVHVPVNTRLRHDSLYYLISHCDPAMIIVERAYWKCLDNLDAAHQNTPIITRHPESGISWNNSGQTSSNLSGISLEEISVCTDDVLFIMYTSGTTGPPKGVLVTDKMLRASAYASGLSSDARRGDVFPVWEPLYHIGAAQLLPMALVVGVELHFVGPFSASRFWQQVRSAGATHVHFLGGILQILLRQPPSPQDKLHHCRVAWGGGAPSTVAKEFELRFGIEVRENYGMTEASSLTSINDDGHKGSVGKPAPYFDVRIIDQRQQPVAVGEPGEIIVRERERGLITPGYFRNDEATRKTIQAGWLFTGDMGFLDESGYLHYAGRLKESIRRRGENISAWEIERVVERLGFVEQAAAIGIPDDLGDEAIKLFVKLAENIESTGIAAEVFEWCKQRLAKFQVPTYLEIIDEFPLTGTQRIRKELLSKSVENCAIDPGN